MEQPRPTWLTATMVAVGIVGAPLAILLIALMVGSADLSETTGVGIAFFGFVALGAITTGVRAVRPLGVGMVIGSAALALMFLVQGGTSG